MDDKVRLVLIGYTKLSSRERRAFINELNAFRKMTTPDRVIRKIQLKHEQEQSEKKSEAVKMGLGPLDDPCPCCGR